MKDKDKARAFGKIVKARREHFGFTQAELASRAAVSLRALQNVEHGSAAPSVYAADRIVKVLGSDLGEMLGEAECMLREEREEKARPWKPATISDPWTPSPHQPSQGMGG